MFPKYQQKVGASGEKNKMENTLTIMVKEFIKSGKLQASQKWSQLSPLLISSTNTTGNPKTSSIK